MAQGIDLKIKSESFKKMSKSEMLKISSRFKRTLMAFPQKWAQKHVQPYTLRFFRVLFPFLV